MSLIEDSLDIVERTFRSFCDELMASYGNIDFTLKKDHSQVTYLDRKIETTLRKKLSGFSELGFEGEETGVFGSRDTYWLIDPIDGTVPFIRGLPYCTNMAALIDNNQVIASIIYDFVHDAMYVARKDHGAYKNGHPISVSSRSLDNSYLAIESPKFAEIRNLLGNDRIKCVTPFSTAGHGFIMTAEGKIEGRLQYQGFGKKYDYAPGALLVKEAGGKIIPLGEKEYGAESLNFAAVAPTVGVRVVSIYDQLVSLHEKNNHEPLQGHV